MIIFYCDINIVEIYGYICYWKKTKNYYLQINEDISSIRLSASSQFFLYVSALVILKAVSMEKRIRNYMLYYY